MAGSTNRARALLAAALLLPALALALESTCYGTVSNGRLENGVRLPARGANYAAYSKSARLVGRTYVHSRVRDAIASAYHALEAAAPDKVFLYGETGWKAGGRFKPHRTHQNGLSVDFMVPVLDRDGRSVPLPTSLLNKFGYSLEFDAAGRLGGLTIDFAALAEHLYQLDVAAKQRRIGLALVIFDVQYLPFLFATPRGAYLKEHVTFLHRKPWVRHDDHYHVDFAVACKP